MASARPPLPLRTGRFDDDPLVSEDGFRVEAFGPGWALLSCPYTGEAWVMEGVRHLGSEAEDVSDEDRIALATCWIAPKGH